MTPNLRCTIAIAFLSAFTTAQAQVAIETVVVGNPGNQPELSGSTTYMYGNLNGIGEPRLCGRVDYVYEIGRFEVTSAQYVAFLNAVATTDTYGLYNTGMAGPTFSCGIVRGGDPGSYTYSVAPEWADRPIAYVSWADALRFVNWLHNGQPSGPQDATTTEDGSYPLNGATTNVPLQTVERRDTATWVLPSEDEWYKAAYHLNNGPTGGYADFPMGGNIGGFGMGWPSNDVVTPDAGNNANFWQSTLAQPDDDCIGPPYWKTPVGEFENSSSYYGTFDQGGNIWEWTDSHAATSGQLSRRILRGGSYYNVVETADHMHAAWRNSEITAAQLGRHGFRVARVLKDCNANGTADVLELANGTAFDRNYNGILDSCDIVSGGSSDCNANGVPDEAEIGQVVPTAYQWDDGTYDEPLGIGMGAEGSFVWLSEFTVAPGRETISAVALSFGYVDIGKPFVVAVWSDPNNDGSPLDGFVLTSAVAAVQDPFSDFIQVVDVPDAHVGPPGTRFFVGALMQLGIEDYPANVDYSSSNSTTPVFSWALGTTNTEDPLTVDTLALAQFASPIPQYNLPGNWIMHAIPAPAAVFNDLDSNGVPDDCQGPSCDADVNCDFALDGFDVEVQEKAVGGDTTDYCQPDPDFNGDFALDGFDVEAVELVVGGGPCP